MPRKPRFYLPGITVHIVQRGHSRQSVFLRRMTIQLTWIGWVRQRVAWVELCEPRDSSNSTQITLDVHIVPE
ncbi:MAG: hypothetical protein ABFS39_16185 [Pseudomonadota bacterium]